jgi:hypothetical protein
MGIYTMKKLLIAAVLLGASVSANAGYHANGLATNGMSIRNGLKNGLSNGLKNGLKNGLRHETTHEKNPLTQIKSQALVK